MILFVCVCAFSSPFFLPYAGAIPLRQTDWSVVWSLGCAEWRVPHGTLRPLATESEWWIKPEERKEHYQKPDTICWDSFGWEFLKGRNGTVERREKKKRNECNVVEGTDEWTMKGEEGREEQTEVCMCLGCCMLFEWGGSGSGVSSVFVSSRLVPCVDEREEEATRLASAAFGWSDPLSVLIQKTEPIVFRVEGGRVTPNA